MKIIILILILSFSLAKSQTVLFKEDFEDNLFESRGWYDAPKGTITNIEHNIGSEFCFECKFKQNGKGCSAGTPGRHLFAESNEVYLSYYVKYSSNWQGSNKPYHPHEFHFVTNVDDKYIGPSITHLTLYIEQNEGRPLLALQDSKNVDTNCILQNNDKFIGCNGDFNKYQFSENRSVASCNGLIGGLDRRDCFYYGSGYYYSSRAWAADSVYFREQPGKYYKSDWHHIEAYFKLNNITNGIGIPDGQIRYWYDSELLISYDNILFRTAQFPDMKFNQFLIAPYIGDGSPIEQTMWIDDLTVATSRLSTDVLEENINGLILSPNPAGDFIEINVGARHAVPLPEQLEIFNIFGEKESTSVNFVDTSASGGHLRIDISNLAPGVYFIKIGDKFEKFVKW